MQIPEQEQFHGESTASVVGMEVTPRPDRKDVLPDHY